MAVDPASLARSFDPPDPQRWREAIAAIVAGGEDALVRRTHDRIELRPLYRRGDAPAPAGLPGTPPFLRGAIAAAGRWEVRSRIAHPDPGHANRQALDELAGGADGLLLVIDDRVSVGEAVPNGSLVHGVDELAALLDTLPIGRRPIRIEAGWRFGAVAALLVAHLRRIGQPLTVPDITVHADPLGSTARGVPIDLDAALARAVEMALWDRREGSRLMTLLADGLPYHDGGSSSAQELGCALAVAVAYLRALDPAGMPPAEATARIAFRLSIDTDIFLNIAKLRALRLMWHRVTEACGTSAEGMRIAAQSAERMMAARDVHVNLLRGTAACFAAAAGGADAITVLPFDHALGPASGLARRLARTTQLILREESGLYRVADPAGGSWAVEALTRDLAREAWSLFQIIESGGGIGPMLMRGSVQEWIAEIWAERASAVARRVECVTGVNAFPELDEPTIPRESVDSAPLVAATRRRLEQAMDTRGVAFDAVVTAAAAGRAILYRGPVAAYTPITPHRMGEAFEALRDRGDAWLQSRGSRPAVFIARLGDSGDAQERAGRAAEIFRAGGFSLIESEPLSPGEAAGPVLAEAGCRLAILAGSDDAYAREGAAALRALAEAGAWRLWVVDPPEGVARELEPGAAGAIRAGDDVVAILEDAYAALGDE
jgi:methylmalonyl-CoA mutase